MGLCQESGSDGGGSSGGGGELGGESHREKRVILWGAAVSNQVRRC